jgi:hypothetical protein
MLAFKESSPLLSLPNWLGQQLLVQLAPQLRRSVQDDRIVQSPRAPRFSTSGAIYRDKAAICWLGKPLAKTTNMKTSLLVSRLDCRREGGSPQLSLVTGTTQCGELVHRSAVMLALNTGMRYSEIRLLQWKDVDFSSQILTVGKSKTQTGTGRRRNE